MNNIPAIKIYLAMNSQIAEMNHNKILITMETEYKSYNTVPLKKGETDNHRTRMERWEEANHKKLNSLTDEEWLDVVPDMLALTRLEAEEFLWSMRMQNMEDNPQEIHLKK
jgi:hypothetical protein